MRNTVDVCRRKERRKDGRKEGSSKGKGRMGAREGVGREENGTGGEREGKGRVPDQGQELTGDASLRPAMPGIYVALFLQVEIFSPINQRLTPIFSIYYSEGEPDQPLLFRE